MVFYSPPPQNATVWLLAKGGRDLWDYYDHATGCRAIGNYLPQTQTISGQWWIVLAECHWRALAVGCLVMVVVVVQGKIVAVPERS